MRYSPILLLMIAMLCWSQTTTTGKAETKGSCSPAVTGSNNQFKIICRGIGKEQGDALLKILNQILANQLDTNAVLKQLQENQGWPRLTQKQIQALCSELGLFRGQKVHIVVSNQTADRLALATQLRDALKSPQCDWDAGVDTMILMGPPDASMPLGIQIQVKDATPAAQALRNGLIEVFGEAAIKANLSKVLTGEFIEIDIWYKPGQ